MKKMEKEKKSEKQRLSLLQVLKILAAIFLVCLYPCIFMYVSNLGETHIGKICIPLIAFLCVAFVVILINKLIFKNPDKAGVLTCLFMLFFVNFNFLTKILCSVIGSLSYKASCIIVLILGCIILAVFMIKKFDYEAINLIVVIVFGTLIVVNFLSAIPKFSDMGKVDGFVEVKEYAKKRDKKPNVYYVFLDEYGGSDNLKYYYDFDNKEFNDFLVDNKFSVSENTRNYEGMLTKELLPNMVNMEYVTKAGGLQNNNMKYMEDPVLFRFFKEMGYDINVINHMNFIKNKDVKTLFESTDECVENAGVGSDDIDNLLISNSAISTIFMCMGAKSSTYDAYRDDLKNMFSAFKDCYKETGKDSTFTFAYLQVPHAPFVFDENGNNVDDSKVNSFTEKELYINFMKYVNKQIEEFITNVRVNDPDSVIVIQSDHGSRYAMFRMKDYKKSDYDAELETEKMQNALNCVYIGGEDFNIEGLTAVNTWRRVLNHVFGTNYEDISTEEYIYKWKPAF